MSQQNPNPQADDAVHAPKSRNRRSRPFRVEYLASCRGSKDWRVWGEYRTGAERDAAMEQLQRKYGFYEWRAQA